MRRLVPVLRCVRRVCDVAAAAFRCTGRWIYRSPMEKRCEPWFAGPDNEMRRTDFPLIAQSLVFDLGGYEREWTSDVFARYGCPVYVFEPVPAFAAAIRKRFLGNPAIRVFDFGLAGSNGEARIGMSADASSLYNEDAPATVDIRLVDAMQFLEEHNIQRIDLMKINIEGGEYNLLERLVHTAQSTASSNSWCNFTTLSRMRGCACSPCSNPCARRIPLPGNTNLSGKAGPLTRMHIKSDLVYCSM